MIELYKNIYIEVLIKESILSYYKELLISIHKHYPKLFTKKHLIYYYKIISRKIIIRDSLADKYLDIHKKSKLFAYNKKIKYINKKFNTNINEVEISKKHSTISQSIRCSARIYGNGLKYKKIIKGRPIIICGSQCNRKKMNGKEYCHIHNDNNKYGNYNDIPKKTVMNKFKLKKKL